MIIERKGERKKDTAGAGAWQQAAFAYTESRSNSRGVEGPRILHLKSSLRLTFTV